MGDIILKEVLQGFRLNRDFQRALEALRLFPQINCWTRRWLSRVRTIIGACAKRALTVA